MKQEAITIFDLRALDLDALTQADERFTKCDKPIIVKPKESQDLFERFGVTSSGHFYTVTKFTDFFWHCECSSFEFKGTCKHIGAILPEKCKSCREYDAPRGKECERCEVKNALYLKESSTKPVEKIGDIRI